MKIKLVIIICVFSCFGAFAQKKKVVKKPTTNKSAKVDSTELLNRNQLKAGLQQVEESLDASLGLKDLTANQNGEKRYYDSYKLMLHAGEELFLNHSSADFRVMLSLKTPAKDKQELSYDSQNFTGNSLNKFHYVAPVTGTYTLLATSMDAGKLGKYRLEKTISTPNAIESTLDPAFAAKFKALVESKKQNFKNITAEKIKKDKKDKAIEQERFKTTFELVAGKAALILQDNGGQTANYKTIILETENEEEAKSYFDKIKKQLQVLTRNWTEQSNTDVNYSASTDTDIITMTVNAIAPEKKKKKQTYQVAFVYN
jgi:hypothetical protein